MPSERPAPLPGFRAALASFRLPLAVYLLLCLAIAVAGLQIASQQRDETRQDAIDDLRVMAHIKAQAIVTWLDDRRTEAQILARQLSTAPDFESWFTDGLVPEARRTAIRQRLQAVRAQAALRRVAMTDIQGKIFLADQDEAPALDPPVLAILGEAVRTGEMQLSGLRRAAGTPRSARIHLVVPLIASTGDIRHALGTLYMEIDPNFGFFEIAEEWSGHDPSSETLVIEKDGNDLLILSSRRGSAATVLEQKQVLSPGMQAAMAVPGFEGAMQGVDYRGAQVLAAAAPIARSQWQVIVKVDLSDVLASSRRLGETTWLVVLGMLTVGGGLLLVGWRRQQALMIIGQQAAEARADATELSLRDALDSLPEGYSIIGFDWTYRYVNAAAVRQGRRSRESVVGRKLQHIYPGIEQTEFFAACQRAMEQRVPQLATGPYTFEDGQVRWYENYIEPNEQGISVLFLDVTERRMAEEDALRLSRIVATTWDAVIGTDLDGVVTSWNPSAERIFGYSAGEIIGQKITILAPPDLLDDMKGYLQRVWDGERLTDIETVRMAKNGTMVDISLTVSPVLGTDGAIVGVSAIARDVSERKRLQQEVARNAEILAAEHDLSPDGILVVNQQDRVVSFNRRFADMCGVSPQHRGDDAAIAAIQSAAGRLTKSVSAFSGDRARHEGGPGSDADEIVLPDGAIYERRSVPLGAGSGGLDGRVWYFRNITLHKRHAETAARLAAIVRMSTDAILSTDITGAITSWNAAAEQLLGYSAAEVIGRNIDIFAVPEQKAEVQQRILAVAAGKPVPEFEGVRVRKDGKELAIASRLSPLMDDAGKITGMSAIIRDITEKKQAERALQHVTRALRTLSLANKALVHATDTEGFYQRMCDIIVNEGGYRMAWVGLKLDDAEKNVRPAAVAGHDDGYVAMANVSWADEERGHGPTGTAIRENRIQINQQFATNPKMAPWRANAIRRGYNSSIAVPLYNGEHAFGAITIYAAEPDAFGTEEAALLSDLGDDLSFGVLAMEDRAAREKAGQKLELAMEQTVQAVATTVEMRDPYTAGHQRSVARLAQAIAEKLGLSSDRIHGLRLASVVHDLGKIQIPAEILTKPAKLTDLEYAIIKTHPQTGYDILRNVDFPWPIADIVLQHHEKIDGSGYPQGLKGDAILLESKILCVADVVESITSHRPYRPALGEGAALEEIKAGRGKIYDPAVVDACEAVMREQTFNLANIIAPPASAPASQSLSGNIMGDCITFAA